MAESLRVPVSPSSRLRDAPLSVSASQSFLPVGIVTNGTIVFIAFGIALHYLSAKFADFGRRLVPGLRPIG
jgi:hypothetical protein